MDTAPDTGILDHIPVFLWIVSAVGTLITALLFIKRGFRNEVHEAMTLWVADGGGQKIREIVGEINARDFSDHEVRENESMRKALEEVSACSSEIRERLIRHDERLKHVELRIFRGPTGGEGDSE